MSTNESIELTRKLHQAVNERDAETCLAMAADDIEVVFQPAKMTATGREGFAQFALGMATAFPDLHIEHTNVVADGGRVTVEFRWSGTHGGPIVTPSGTVSATGRRIQDGRACEVMEWRGGKLVRLVNYQDWGSVIAQLTA